MLYASGPIPIHSKKTNVRITTRCWMIKESPLRLPLTYIVRSDNLITMHTIFKLDLNQLRVVFDYMYK